MRRVLDEQVQSSVVELAGRSARTWLRFPPGARDFDGQGGAELQLRQRYLAFLLRPLGDDVVLELQLRDARGRRRRLRAASSTRRARVREQLARLPLRLADGWNLVQLDLPALLRRAYGADAVFAHTISVQLHASCRVRRVWLAEAPAGREQDLPAEFRLFKRLTARQAIELRQQEQQQEQEPREP